MVKIHKLTPQMKQQIWHLEELGYHTKEIAEQIGIARSTVSKYRKTPDYRASGVKPRYNVSRIREMYRNGRSVSQIAMRIGCCENTVRKYIEDLQPLRLSKDALRDKVDELIAQGVVARTQQAKILGVDPSTLYRHFGSNGQPTAFNPTINEIRDIRARYRRGESMRRIADSYGLKTHQVISDIMNKKGRFEFV